MDRRRPTIHDVATLAGVSKSTAARALSGNGPVAAEARERAVAAARSLGYEPNHLAVSMRSGRSRLIGLVIPDIANPFWAEVAKGAQDRAVEEELSLLCFSSDWRPDLEARHLRALVRVRVDGAIVNPVADSAEALQAFGLPLVVIGSGAAGFPGLPGVGSDIPQSVRLGLDHLASRGHGPPALIVGPHTRLARARFVEAVQAGLSAKGLDPDVPVETGDYTVEGGARAMLRLLDRPRHGHLAVFAANDLMALGALVALRERALGCPADASVLGLDGISAGAFSSPGLTTIEKPARAVGRHAVEMLAETIEGRPGDGAVHLPSRLVERGSVADLAAGDARALRAGRG